MLDKLLNWLADRAMPLRGRLDRLHARGFGALTSQWSQTQTSILGRVRLPKPAHFLAWLQTKNGRYVAIASTALTVSALVLVVSYRPAPAAPKSAWFMDLGTGELFVAGYGSVPPIAAPSGKMSEQGQPVGVLAHVFSRGSCWWAWSRYVGYLETMAPEAKTRAGRLFMAGAEPESGIQVCSPGHMGDWVDIKSAKGSEIIGSAVQPDGRGRIGHECYP